ncbi:hypothetical protein [Streptomyces sp. NPDC002088]|uniref:hypothetical protein n=1 Tax=Streptomyces sp. NPDC002088 TaxID=3154665 RepID=UPI003321117F
MAEPARCPPTVPGWRESAATWTIDRQVTTGSTGQAGQLTETRQSELPIGEAQAVN